jgi:UDP-N-acetylmuramate dehydrogenase
LVNIKAAECELDYRRSIFNGREKGRYIITSITLRLKTTPPAIPTHKELAEALSGKPITVALIRATVLNIRTLKLPDPRTTPNVGSFFRNPILNASHAHALLQEYPDVACWPEEKSGNMKFSAAWLIEHCSVRKRRWGGISISEKHSLVLVNNNEQEYARLQEAIHDIIASVRQKFSVVLQPEANLIGPEYLAQLRRAQASAS